MIYKSNKYENIFGLIILLLCSCRLIAQESDAPHNHTIDTAMAISPISMPVYTAQMSGIQFNPLHFEHIDTLTFHIPEYDPLWSSTTLYQSIGINSQAHQNLIFDYKRDLGFTLIDLPYPLYFKKQTDLKFYDVKTSYTQLNYTYGITTENSFTATHAQHRGLCDFAFNLRGSSNGGYFINQKANLFVMDGLFHYETRNGVYGFNISYILNHAKFEENGGLSDYHTFADRDARDSNVTNVLTSFDVRFSNANTLINTHDLLLQQYVNIKDKKGHYFGTITHSFQFKKIKSAFNDFNLNNNYYRDRYYISSDTTADTIRYFGIVNTLQWSNYQPLAKPNPHNYFIRFAAGIQHEFSNSRMPYYVGNSFFLFARTHIRLFKVWDLFGNIGYSFLKYNKNDGIVNAAATFALNRKKQHYLGFAMDFYRMSPAYIYACYDGNNNHWNHTWKKSNTLKLSAYWTMLQYKLSVNYFMLSNYLYFNDQFEPTMANKVINVLQFNAFAPLRLKNFYMDLNASVQHATRPEISLPLFAGKLYAAYCFRIFKNRLHVQVGGNLMYNTLYYGDGYNPILHQFYHQESVKVGNYLYFNADITIQVERVSLFFRAGNLLEGVFSYKYFSTPYYPMQGRNFEIGVNWKFFD